jgi:hypothetical protein
VGQIIPQKPSTFKAVKAVFKAMNNKPKFNAALAKNRSYAASKVSRDLFDDIFGGGSDAGDSIGTARRLGRLRRGSSFNRSGSVGRRDLDFFSFSVDRNIGFSAELENESNDEPIALTILDRQGNAVTNNGSLLFRNVEAGDTQTISVSNLPRGEYFARLQSVNGRGEDYNLRLSGSTSGSNGGGTGNSRNIGRLARNRTYRYEGTVGGQDLDRYQFSTDRRDRLTTSLFNDSDDSIAVSILDSNNQVVQTNSGRFLFGNAEPGDSVDLFAPTLPAGSYTVRVQSAVGSREDYELSLRRGGSLFS